MGSIGGSCKVSARPRMGAPSRPGSSPPATKEATTPWRWSAGSGVCRMLDSSRSFEDSYRAALIDYLTSGDESGRAEAYELGRRAVAEAISLLELAALHRQGEAEWLTQPLENLKVDYAESTQFFLEALSTFDMAQR